MFFLSIFYLMQLMPHVHQLVIILKIIFIILIIKDAAQSLQIVSDSSDAISDVSQLLKLMQSSLSFILETFPLPDQS